VHSVIKQIIYVNRKTYFQTVDANNYLLF